MATELARHGRRAPTVALLPPSLEAVQGQQRFIIQHALQPSQVSSSVLLKVRRCLSYDSRGTASILAAP